MNTGFKSMSQHTADCFAHNITWRNNLISKQFLIKRMSEFKISRNQETLESDISDRLLQYCSADASTLLLGYWFVVITDAAAGHKANRSLQKYSWVTTLNWIRN